MSRETDLERFESVSGGERVRAATSPSFQPHEFEHHENFDFEAWASAVKRQLLAALRKEA